MSPRLRNHRAPFPYFGGKAAIADDVWARLGDVGRYVEPFAGSLAVLLARPRPFSGREIVNDSDGLLVNVWRAMAADPDAVAAWCDWPATESDLHARHAWLVGQRETLTTRLEGDPDWFDAKAAGWWLWGIGLWIGGGWCSGEGPWRVEDGQLLHAGDDGRGVHRKLLHAGNDGQEATTGGASTGSASGIGVSRKALPHTGNSPMHGVHSDAIRENLAATFAVLADRLRGVMIMAGDWTRVVTPAVLLSGGSSKPCGIFLDPPYADTAGRTADLYATDSETVAHAVREWAITNGDNPAYRIALCGYEGEHQMPPTWSELAWKAHGGYEGQAKGGRTGNSRRERVWFSPTCDRASLWEAAS